MSQWINEVIKSDCVPGVSMRCVRCSPYLAGKLLELNTHNRRISNAVVDKYVEEIKNGEWVATAQGVGIDDRGVLSDGQHRLSAIVKSGVTVPLLVVWNLPPMGQEKVDRQRKRTIFDALVLSGRTESRQAVQVSTLLAKIDSGLVSDNYHGDRYTPSDSQVKLVLEVHSEAINALCNKGHDFRVGMVAAMVIGYEINPTKTMEFRDRALHPVELAFNSPIYRFRQWQNSGISSKSGDGQLVDYAKTGFCLSAYFDGRTITQVREIDAWPPKNC